MPIYAVPAELHVMAETPDEALALARDAQQRVYTRAEGEGMTLTVADDASGVELEEE